MREFHPLLHNHPAFQPSHSDTPNSHCQCDDSHAKLDTSFATLPKFPGICAAKPTILIISVCNMCGALFLFGHRQIPTPATTANGSKWQRHLHANHSLKNNNHLWETGEGVGGSGDGFRGGLHFTGDGRRKVRKMSLRLSQSRKVVSPLSLPRALFLVRPRIYRADNDRRDTKFEVIRWCANAARHL